MGSARVLMAVEDHGAGRQYVRVATWPRFSKVALVLITAAAFMATAGALSGHYIVPGVLALTALLLFGECLAEAGRSQATVLQAIERQEPDTSAESEAAGEDRFAPNPAVAPWQPAAIPRSGEDG
jgi:hypothetical protein